MMNLLVALLQAPATAPAPPTRIDLLRPAPTCPADTGDVVVCGRRNPMHYRLRPLAEPADAGPARAAVKLGGGELSATVDQAVMPTGEVSKRAMVNLRLPF